MYPLEFIMHRVDCMYSNSGLKSEYTEQPKQSPSGFENLNLLPVKGSALLLPNCIAVIVIFIVCRHIFQLERQDVC